MKNISVSLVKDGKAAASTEVDADEKFRLSATLEIPSDTRPGTYRLRAEYARAGTIRVLAADTKTR